jgi:hypothetical protein
MFNFMLTEAFKKGNLNEYESLVRGWYATAETIEDTVDREPPEVYFFWEQIKRCVVGRKLFQTQRGYLGLGLTSLEPGDQVCILFGGRTPFILRPLNDGTFRFIGEHYIHGTMSGEALNEGRKRCQEFIRV